MNHAIRLLRSSHARLVGGISSSVEARRAKVWSTRPKYGVLVGTAGDYYLFVEDSDQIF